MRFHELSRSVSKASPLGAKEVAAKLENWGRTGEKHPSAAKTDINPAGFMRRLKPPPPSGPNSSATGKARSLIARVLYGLNLVRFRLPIEYWTRPVPYKLILALMTVALLARADAGAQQVGTNTAPGQTENYKLTLNSQLVVEQVVVKDKQGNFVNGLTAKDFTVTEDGVPQTIKFCDHQQFSNATGPLPPTPADDENITIYNKLTHTQIAPEPPESNKYKDKRLIALYFDMTALPPQDQMRALSAAETFVRTQMTAADLISILEFNGGSVAVLQDFTADRNRLLSILQTLVVGGIL